MQHINASQKILAALTAGLFVSGAAMAADPVTYIKIDDVRETTGDPIGSIAIGLDGTTAKNQSSIAVGTGVSADGNGAIAIGSYANAIGTAATAVGQGTKATEQSAAAFGQKAQATAGASTAVGSGTQATDQSAAAFGAGATATARNAAAIAANAKAEGINSVAIGQKALAQNSGSTAVGTGSQATQGSSSAFGSGAVATGAGATALGQGTQASGSNTVAIGQKSHASGSTATAIGSGSEASGTNSIANGTSAKATSNFTIATGSNATASATNSIATGKDAQATGVNSIATGAGAQANGAFSVASGLTAQADGNQAIAIGRKATAANDFSVALGSFSTTEAAVGTNEATVNGITYSGFAGNTPTGTVSVGNAEQKRTITNVAAGRINATSTDAINGSQLYLVANELKNAATVITSEDGSVIVDKPTTNDQGGNVYNLSVKTDKATITNEGGMIKANTAALADADKDGKIDAPSTDDGKKLITAGDVANAINASGFTAKANGDAGELVNPGEAIDFINGQNIEITREGSKFTVATAKDVQFDSVTFGDNGPKITNKDGNINVAGNDGSPAKITGVANGTGDNDAVNVSQLKAAQAKVEATGLATVSSKSDENGTVYTVDVAKADVPTVERGSVTVKAGDENKVMTAGDVAKAITDSERTSSVKAGSDAVTVTPGEEDANGNTEYVVDVNTDKTITRDAEGKLSVNTGNSLKVDADSGKIDVNTDDKTITVNDAGQVTAVTTNLTNSDKGAVNAPSTEDAGKLVTAQTVADAINKSGFTAKANGDAGELINPGDEVEFINGKNIEITREGGKFTVATAKDVTFDSVTFGDDGPKITNKDGNINVGGNDGSPTKITGVANGTGDNDAVNVSQLKAAKTEVVAGDNVVVSAPSTNPATGATQYTVSANSSSTAAGSDYVTVTPSTTTGANGATNTTYSVDLSEKTKAAIQNMVNIDNRLDDMEDDLRAGIAGATAIAFLQRPNEAGKSIVSAAVGGFRDQQALAIGYARNSDNNKWSIKAGVGINTRKDVNWGGSIGYQW